MSSSSLYRTSGIVLIIAAVVGVVSNIITAFLFPNTGPGVPVSDVTSGAWGPLGTVSFVCTVLLLFGVIGVYIRQAHRAGIVGLLVSC